MTTDQMSSTGSTEVPINLRTVGQILLISHAQRTANIDFSLVVELIEFKRTKTGTHCVSFILRPVLSVRSYPFAC